MLLSKSAFPFIEFLEKRDTWRRVAAEVQQLAANDFIDWPIEGSHLGQWRVFPLVFNGTGVGSDDHAGTDLCSNNQRRCPDTTSILSEVPGLHMGAFSLLSPGTHITPHEDIPSPPTYRCHLTVSQANECFLRVGDVVTTWHRGQCLIMDGQTNHEAVNFGQGDRVVLILDVKRSAYPEARPAPESYHLVEPTARMRAHVLARAEQG